MEYLEFYLHQIYTMITYKIILYKSKTYKNGFHPVMLQASFNGRIKRISLDFEGTPKEWDDDKQRFRKNSPGYQTKNQKLDEVDLFAQSLNIGSVMERKKMTLEEFIQRLKHEDKQTKVFDFFDARIEELQRSGKAGNAFVYTCARNALWNYTNDANLFFEDIDYRFLQSFETDMRSRDCKNGGISNYMRTIRALYNEAIRRGLADQQSYPFSTQFNKSGYSIAKLKTSFNPRAMSEKDLEKLKNFTIEQYPEYGWAYRMFMFSYFEFGINFSDMARLTHDNLHGDTLVYTRKKTGKDYALPLHPEAKKIIELFSGKDYLFPIFSSFHKTEQQKLNRIMKKRKQFNKIMKEIGKLLDIKTKLTSYVARHTAATTMKRRGVSEDVISEALGHSDVKTTKHYLKKFGSKVLETAATKL